MTEVALRPARYRGYARLGNKRKNSPVRHGLSLAETVIRQAGISILLLLLVFILKGIDTPATDFIMDKAKWVTISNTDTDGVFKSIDLVISKISNFRLPFAVNESSAEKGFESTLPSVVSASGNYNIPGTSGVPLDTADRTNDPQFTGIPMSGTHLSSSVASSTFTVAVTSKASGASAVSSTSAVSGPTAVAAISNAFESSASNISKVPVVLKLPLFGKVTAFFGPRIHPILKRPEFHEGIDIDADMGDPIKACAAGTVIFSGVNGGYGNCIKIDHGNGFITLYGHCSKLLVKKGDKADSGAVIAKVGSTGLSTGPHLHLEIWKDGKPVDPLIYLNFN